MQEFHDDQTRQLKKIAKFETEKEFLYKRMSVYEFFEHLAMLIDEQPD